MVIKKGYKKTEVGIIPIDWQIYKMKSICDVRDGTHESPKYYNNGIKFITSKNIINGKIDFTDISYISIKDANSVDKRSKVDKGDILMSMIGTIGNCVLVDFEPNFCIKNVALLKPEKILGIFLIQIFFSPNYQAYINSKLDGGIQKFISLNVLRSLDVPIPPTNTEQTAIATALNDADSLITQIEKLIAKKRAIKQGAMQELLKPKAGWAVKKFGDNIQLQGGSQPPLTTFIPKPKEGYIRLLQIRDYKTDKYETYIPISLAKKFCKKDDIMIGRYGPPVFQILKGLEGAYNVALMKAIPKNNTSKPFVYHFLKQNSLLKFVEKLSQRTAGQSGIDIKELNDYPFFVPPLNEQIHISQILTEMDSELELMEMKLEKLKMLKQGMMQNLLTGKIRLV